MTCVFKDGFSFLLPRSTGLLLFAPSLAGLNARRDVCVRSVDAWEKRRELGKKFEKETLRTHHAHVLRTMIRVLSMDIMCVRIKIVYQHSFKAILHFPCPSLPYPIISRYESVSILTKHTQTLIYSTVFNYYILLWYCVIKKCPSSILTCDCESYIIWMFLLRRILWRCF